MALKIDEKSDSQVKIKINETDLKMTIETTTVEKLPPYGNFQL